MRAFCGSNSESSLECYTLGICLLKTGAKIQDGYLNYMVSPTDLKAVQEVMDLPYGLSSYILECFSAHVWEVPGKTIVNRSEM